jgi:beta-mannanase
MYYFFSTASRLRSVKLLGIYILLSLNLIQAQEVATLPLASRVLIGAYTHGGVWNGMEAFHQLETSIGRKMDIVHWYTSWNNEFEADIVTAATHAGQLPMISWQSNQQPLETIISGHHDAYIRRWAIAARDYGNPIYLRPFPEMNGFWTSWYGQPEKMVIAWKHTVDIFRAEGATNVYWVWSPNVTDDPTTETNRMEHYYPGSDYVDILALDGYNWGNLKPYTEWESFESIFANAIARLEALGPQPIWAAEVASTEHGGDKAAWVREMFASTAFPRLEAVVWFNENKETDWRVDSSAEVLQAFQDSLSGSLASR